MKRNKDVLILAALSLLGHWANGAEQCVQGEKRLRDADSCIPAPLFNYLYCLQNSSNGLVEVTKHSDDAKGNSLDIKLGGEASGVVLRGNANGQITKSESARAASELQAKLSPDLAANCKSLADTLSASPLAPVPKSDANTAEAAAFKSATKINTPAAYRAYLTAFENGAHAADVRRRIDLCAHGGRATLWVLHKKLTLRATGISDDERAEQLHASELTIRDMCEQRMQQDPRKPVKFLGVEGFEHHWQNYDSDAHTRELTVTGNCSWSETMTEDTQCQ